MLTLIFFMVLVSLILRYPLVEHERHNDTFFNRQLAGSILDEDYAVWTYHPLSYIGYYPLSYPSGTPFLLAEISELTGANLSASIWILGVFCGILYTLAAFCLSRVLLSRIDICVLATLLSVLAPRFVDISYWSGSARAPFVALSLLAVFVAFKSASYGRSAIVVLWLVVIGCFALHHLAVAFVIFGLAYFLTSLTIEMIHSIDRANSLMSSRKKLAGILVAISGISVFILAVSYLSYFGPSLEENYASTNLFSSEEWKSIVIALNMAASYTHQIGFVFPIAVLGFPLYFSRGRLTVATLFPVVLIISFVPLLPRAEYITMVIAPFAAVLGATWFETALKMNRLRRTVMAGLVILISASFILPAWSTDRWNGIESRSGDSIESDTQLFVDAGYMDSLEDDICAVSSTDVLSIRLAGLSGVPFLGPGVTSTLTGDISKEALEGNLSLSSYDFPQNLYALLEYDTEYDLREYIIRYFTLGNQFPASMSDPWLTYQDYYESHSRLLVVIDNRWPDTYTWTWGTLAAKLPSELRNAEWYADSTAHQLQSYSIYASERVTLYITEIPDSFR